MERITDDSLQKPQPGTSKATFAWVGNEDKNLSSSLNIFLFALSACGLFHSRHGRKTQRNENGINTQKRSFIDNLHFVFCIVILSILFFDFARMLVSVFVGYFVKEFRYLRIIGTCWACICLSNAIFCLLCGLSKDRFKLFLEQWTCNQQKAFEDIGIRTNRKKVLWKTKLFLGLSTVMPTVNVLSMVVLSYTDLRTRGEQFIYSSTGPWEPTQFTEIIFIILYALGNCAWMFPIGFFGLICSVVLEDATTFNKHFKEILRKYSGKIGNHLMHLRRGHLELCKTIQAVDQCFRIALFLWISIHIAIGCVCANILVKSSADAFALYVYIYWLMCDFFGLGFVTVYAALVHNEAHGSLEFIHDVDISGMTREQTSELNLLQSKLTASPIGISAMGLVTITKDLLLTIAGLYLTYFIILVQF